MEDTDLQELCYMAALAAIVDPKATPHPFPLTRGEQPRSVWWR